MSSHKSKELLRRTGDSAGRVEKSSRSRRSGDSHTRGSTACDACRQGKTRCDNGRPSCARCAANDLACVYSDSDPITVIETLGVKILAAIDRLDSKLSSNEPSSIGATSLLVPNSSEDSLYDHLDAEVLSRNDSLKTCVTGADAMLSWQIFPTDKPVAIFGPPAYCVKQDRFIPETPSTLLDELQALRHIYAYTVHPKTPIVYLEQLDDMILTTAQNGLQSCAETCLVLIVCAVALIWEHPTRSVCSEVLYDYPGAVPRLRMSLSISEGQMKTSIAYMAAARAMMSAAFLDDTLVGVQCHCLFGYWYLCNIEPVQGWKMFRTAALLWQAYHAKNLVHPARRGEREESLEQRLYWACLKAECEIRFELPQLPSSYLWATEFPFSFPSFTTCANQGQVDEVGAHARGIEPASYYFYLAELSLRRLLNRMRNSLGSLHQTSSAHEIRLLTIDLNKHEDSLQQWYDCLPPSLRFTLPHELEHPGQEDELIQLLRERYMQALEQLRRPYLYLCLHVQLDDETRELSTQKANECLRLAAYRLQTEKPFCRHPGSWGSCRIRFNHALCLIAAFKGKTMGRESAQDLELPPSWEGLVRLAIDRLKVWQTEGAGIAELSILLEWLLHN